MKKGLIALSPLVVFIVLYLVTSIIARDFYKVPITVAFMVASIYAVTVMGGIPLQKRIDIYSKGAGTGQMMLMLWIFVLAGAFANTAKAMGAIDATVNLTPQPVAWKYDAGGTLLGSLLHLSLHRYECRNNCSLDTNCCWYCHTNRY
jgi:putative methionine transporter, NhaC family (TC 2.A.35.1.-)